MNHDIDDCWENTDEYDESEDDFWDEDGYDDDFCDYCGEFYEDCVCDLDEDDESYD